MLRNEQALNHLLESFADVRGMSSHWRHYQQRFTMEGNGRFHVEGIEGYTPHVMWKAPLHAWLQRGYLRCGNDFPEFAAYLRHARDITRQWGAQLDQGMLRQVLTLARVGACIPLEHRLHLVIGDGFGALGALILAAIPGSRVLYVNLPKFLLLDLHFCGQAHPGISMVLARDGGELSAALADPNLRVIALKAGNGDLIARAPVSVAYNVASMQEMDMGVIGHYFRAMRGCPTPVHFYCCNRVEKTLPDGSVIRFEDYPWREGDQWLLDERCPWHQTYYTLRPPFWHPYDGPLQHRLALLARENPPSGPSSSPE